MCQLEDLGVFEESKDSGPPEKYSFPRNISEK